MLKPLSSPSSPSSLILDGGSKLNNDKGRKKEDEEDEEDSGDILLLGKGILNSSIYVNDSFVLNDGIKDSAAFGLVETIFQRTGYNTSKTKLPRDFLGVDENTNVIMINSEFNNNEINFDKINTYIIYEVISLSHEDSDVYLHRPIAKLTLLPKRESNGDGYGLLFKHNIDKAPKPCLSSWLFTLPFYFIYNFLGNVCKYCCCMPKNKN